MQATLTLGLRRDEMVERARTVLGDRVDDLLAQGAVDGEESTVAEAHTIIRADGLNVDSAMLADRPSTLNGHRASIPISQPTVAPERSR